MSSDPATSGAPIKSATQPQPQQTNPTSATASSGASKAPTARPSARSNGSGNGKAAIKSSLETATKANGTGPKPKAPSRTSSISTKAHPNSTSSASPTTSSPSAATPSSTTGSSISRQTSTTRKKSASTSIPKVNPSKAVNNSTKSGTSTPSVDGDQTPRASAPVTVGKGETQVKKEGSGSKAQTQAGTNGKAKEQTTHKGKVNLSEVVPVTDKAAKSNGKETTTTADPSSEQGQAKPSSRSSSKRPRSRGGKKTPSSGLTSPITEQSPSTVSATSASVESAPAFSEGKRTIIPKAVDALAAAMSAREQKAEEGEKKAMGSLQDLISTLKTLPPTAKGSGEGRKSSGAQVQGGKGGGRDRQASSTTGSSGNSPDKDKATSGDVERAQSQRPTTAPIAIPDTPTSALKLKADATPFTPSFTSPTASVMTQPLPSSLDPPSNGLHRTSFSAATAPPPLLPLVQAQTQQQQIDINSPETLQTLITMQVQTMLQQIIGQHGSQGLTPEVVQAVQQQATIRALQQIQVLDQNQQQQQLQQQQQAQASLPPRFQARGSVIEHPLYEEEAVDESSDTFSPTHRNQNLHAPSFSMSDRRRSSQGVSLGAGDAPEQRYTQEGISGYGQQQHVDRGVGINAGVLAGIAARAHARNGSEMTPLMAEQLDLQRQIESLQEQQRLLLHQQSAQQQQPGLSALSQALIGQQTLQMQSQREAQEALYHQTVLQNQQLQIQAQAMLQAQAQVKAQQAAQLVALGQSRMQSPPSGQQLQDYILSNPQRQSISGLPPTEGPARRISDMGPPAAPSASHRRKDSAVQRHRPTNSIIGSFGGYVPDVPDNDISSHNRSASRSSTMGDWRFGGSAAGAAGASAGGQSDLASAQAQLQMLAQFRQTQIGAGGHSKMASFSFPNILPNLMMASTIAPVNQSIAQQQQAFQLQLQQNQGSGPGPARKSLFAPYLPQGSLPPLLTAGKLVVGVLRINLKNRSDAYVTTDVLDGDIFISGSKDRNRALNGDVVAVELLDVDEVWNAKKEKEEKKRRKEDNASYDFGNARAPARKPEKKDDIEVEGQGLVLVEEDEMSDEQKPRYCGHVVAVVERMSNQTYSGLISVMRPSSMATKEKQDAERRERDGDREVPGRTRQPPQEAPKIIWHIASDRRTPLIAIPTNQAPADFVQNPEKYANRLFTAIIKRWPITSLHPFGALVEEIGEVGTIEVETAALLKNCNVAPDAFAESTLKCLPPTPWTIPEREYETRRDMRSDRVFTIDPRTAKDLDDALCVKSNSDGTYEVSVHIADVSYFVRPSTPLDRDARKRATSVYLVEKAVPMLPPILCEQLCSLVPGVDRLAFAVFFKIDEEGNVLAKHFERTVIKSCVKLAYEDAQIVIDGGQLPAGKDIAKECDPQDIERDILLLQSLASKLRARRFTDGALKINNVKLSFELDHDGRAIDCSTFEGRSANALVEEFMLLANFAAAQVCANGLPEQALLRRHEAPIQRRIDGFVSRAKRLGFEFGGTTSTDIQTGFDAVDNTGDKLCLQIIATRSMNKAKYFCAGMLDIAKYSHFALNAPVYTHFTSPIRRYADVLVHRMLDACMTTDVPENKFTMDRDQVAKCAQHCNAKKDAAKIAQEQSVHLHLCHLIHDLTQKFGPVVRDAKVVHVLDSAFDVVVPEFGIEKRVHVDKVPIENHVFDERDSVLSLYWSEQDVLSFLGENADDDHLRRVRASSEMRNRSREDEKADADAEQTKRSKSKQQQKSAKGEVGAFEGLRQESGHRIQDVKELQNVPVIVSADIMKSPPVIIVYAVNPYASE